MSGVVTHLGAIGIQDEQTFIDPEVTFFRTVVPRHTHFVLQPHTYEFSGNADWGKTFSAELERHGDLLARLWLVVELGELDAGGGGARYTDDVGRAMMEKVELKSGGVVYNELEPEWLHAEEELDRLSEQQLGLVTGKTSSVAQLTAVAQRHQQLYVPLTFYFSKDYGAALPLVATHLSRFHCTVKLRAKAAVIVTTGGAYTVTAADAELVTIELRAELVFLSDDERNWFGTNPHKYVIEQIQGNGVESLAANATSKDVELDFNHPTKCLYVMQRPSLVENQTSTSAYAYFDWSGSETGRFANEAFLSMRLRLNGSNHSDAQDPLWFRACKSAVHFKRVPDKHVYPYPFSLHPLSEYGSTGVLNLSKVDSARLSFTYTAATAVASDILVFAQSLNVLTIENGQAQLRYAS